MFAHRIAAGAGRDPELFKEDAAVRTDLDIQQDVVKELHRAPEVHDQDIAVKVSDGLVTLTGFVGNELERYTAECAVKGIPDVVALANDIEVKLPSDNGQSDPAIAREALAAIGGALPLCRERVKVFVHQGHITLEGDLDTELQRGDVERAVRGLKAVTSVCNLIRVSLRRASSGQV
jgi:osmotically-inducible protein OsmY